VHAHTKASSRSGRSIQVSCLLCSGVCAVRAVRPVAHAGARVLLFGSNLAGKGWRTCAGGYPFARADAPKNGC